MTPEPRRPEDLDEILGAPRDGIATDEQVQALEVRLAADPDARRNYLRYIELCSGLRFRRGTAAPAADGRPRRSRLEWRTIWAAAVVLALLSGWLIGNNTSLGKRRSSHANEPAPPDVVSRPGGPGPGGLPGIPAVVVAAENPAPDARPRRGVAVLTRTIAAEWGTTDMPVDAGLPLSAGRIRLKAGLAQIEFFGGAILVLEGPADLEWLGYHRALCRQGKVRVRAALHAQKFELLTPGGEVVDLGTEFAASVAASGESEVQVFEGKVELRRKGTETAPAICRELTAGHGRRRRLHRRSPALGPPPGCRRPASPGNTSRRRRSLRSPAWRPSA